MFPTCELSRAHGNSGKELLHMTAGDTQIDLIVLLPLKKKYLATCGFSKPIPVTR